MKSHRPRSPGRKGRFCWHKQTGPRGVTYRLFRRAETTGQTYIERLHADDGWTRYGIAKELMTMRRELRDAVDAADLKNLGVEA